MVDGVNTTVGMTRMCPSCASIAWISPVTKLWCIPFFLFLVLVLLSLWQLKTFILLCRWSWLSLTVSLGGRSLHVQVDLSWAGRVITVANSWVKLMTMLMKTKLLQVKFVIFTRKNNPLTVYDRLSEEQLLSDGVVHQYEQSQPRECV